MNVTEAWNGPPSILYCNPAPTGAETTIVAVGRAQVGCTVTEAVGAAGAVGTAFTGTAVGAETQVISEVLTAVIL